MSKMHIERSIDIDAPVEKVFQVLNDFNQWAVWSPWLLIDEHPNVRVSEDAKFYEWEGKRTGSGKMQIISE
ncbi:MAG: SRPBCC family protein, partial [Cyclobacteriaceae bacterium]